MTLQDRFGDLPLDRSEEARRRCSRDAWPRLRKLEQAGCEPPLVAGVVRVRSSSDVARVLAAASGLGRPVLPVGLCSGIVGGLQPRGDEIAVDLSGVDRIEALDEQTLTVRVGAGVRGSVLESMLAARGLTTGHYPQSVGLSSVGGWIATASSGITSTLHGSVERRVLGVEVALADGTLVETPAWARASVGPNWTQLFVGSEGALGVICSAMLGILREPASRRFQAFAMPSFEAGLDAVRGALQEGLVAAVARLYNAEEAARFVGEPVPALLLLVHEGVPAMVATEARLLSGRCRELGGRRLDPRYARRWWRHRYDAHHLFAYSEQPGSIADAIEVAASWTALDPLLRGLEGALRPLVSGLHIHASHFYVHGASLYLTFFLDAESPLEAVESYDRVWANAMSICLEAGGAISHHHGIGVVRLPWLCPALGSAAEVLRRVKAGLDPDGILSPGKLAV